MKQTEEDRCSIDQQIVELVPVLELALEQLGLVHHFVLQMGLGLGTFLLIFFEFLFEFILFIIEIRYTDPVVESLAIDRGRVNLRASLGFPRLLIALKFVLSGA